MRKISCLSDCTGAASRQGAEPRRSAAVRGLGVGCWGWARSWITPREKQWFIAKFIEYPHNDSAQRKLPLRAPHPSLPLFDHSLKGSKKAAAVLEVKWPVHTLSSGSNGIPRLARPGRAGLRPHKYNLQKTKAARPASNAARKQYQCRAYSNLGTHTAPRVVLCS